MKAQRKPYGLPFVGLVIMLAFTYTQIDHDEAQQEAWVEQVFQSLSEEQRIAQLFLGATHSNKDEGHYRAIEGLI